MVESLNTRKGSLLVGTVGPEETGLSMKYWALGVHANSFVMEKQSVLLT